MTASNYSRIFFDGPDTFSRIRFEATCGETYTISVAWVFSDGGISQPTSTSGPAPACPAVAPPAVTPPPLADTTRPVVTLAKKRLRLNKKGALLVPLACGSGESHCAGTLTLRAGKNGRRVRLPAVTGTSSFRIAGGTTRSVSVRLRRSGLAALRKAGSLQLVAAITAHDDAGNRASSSVKIRATR